MGMLKQIKTEDAQLGMFVHKMNGSWFSHPFWKSKFVLDDEMQMAELKASDVEWITIDLSKGCDMAAPVTAAQPQADPVESPAPDAGGRQSQILRRAARDTEETPILVRGKPSAGGSLSALRNELGAAANIANSARTKMRAFYTQARLGKTMDVTQIEPMVDNIMASIQRHPHAFTGIVRLMKTSDYLHTHALAVSALMINLATQLKLSAHDVRDAGLAGLLMDVGMGHVPQEIYDKQGPLNPAERTIMHSHTMLARDCMAVEGGISSAVQDVCLHHHERFDGSGYPHGLAGQDISLFARMAAVCDIYDAMTTDRTHRPGSDPATVVTMMREHIHLLDPDIFEAFVRAIGIYPQGSLVRLSSNHLALVLDQNPKNPTLPRVAIFYSVATQTVVPTETVDLVYRIGKDDIVSHEKPEDWGLTEWDEIRDTLLCKSFGLSFK
jgi:HD-GYP domain-containing protein (c-di-GMP phosphodiesterase class II)